MNSYAIYILWLRQIKRYFRSRSRLIGSLGQPIVFLVALGFGFGPVFAKAGGGNYIQFLSPGIISMSIMFTAVFSGIELIWDRQFGFLKETMVAPVSRLSIMFGRTLGGATTSFMQGCIVLIITLVIGFRPDLGMVLWGLLFMFGIAIVFTAFGTAVASTMEDMQGFGLIVNLVNMPLFFLSGALFPLNDAPAWIRYIADANPLTYGVDGLRTALTGVTEYGLGLDALVIAAVTVLFLSVGAWLFGKIEV
ncbi:ABC transporter permease [Patescibacteria group bacterium]|nr:ABC transporter permease [Patescibacteria group bacterium]MDE1946285.1 ABC transporter permease [Patescibacteria group bacterium]MDE2010737.1 ABC transporter permease [Patescibacteria group bacterium]MDE2232621.1 ABC transporter permease [Patescibacteria group bacterium]